MTGAAQRVGSTDRGMPRNSTDGRPIRRGWLRHPLRRVRKMKVILDPLDGSELTKRAVPFATMIAARSGWSLLLLLAVNTLRASTDAAGLALKQAAQEDLNIVGASLAADGVRPATRVGDGQAETAILGATADEDVNLVVMSTHGRGGLGRFI